MSDLTAPCQFCNYHGRGYWQTGTHSKSCPFYLIGGEEARFEYLHNPPTTPDEKDAKIAELEKQLAEATEWRGIESAPMHGDMLCTWIPSLLYNVKSCYQIDGKWFISSTQTRVANPTHWMRQMLPPNEEGK